MLWIARAGCLGFVVLLTALLLAPDPWAILGLGRRAPEVSIPNRGVHFTMFTILALWVHASRWTARMRPMVVLLVVYGLATELLQGLSPHRTVELPDALENLAGIAAGTLAFWAAGRCCGRRRAADAPGTCDAASCGEVAGP